MNVLTVICILYLSLFTRPGPKEQTAQDLERQFDSRRDDPRVVQHPLQSGEVRESPDHGLVEHLAVGGLEGAVQRGHFVPRPQEGVPHGRITQNRTLGALLGAQQAHELAVEVAEGLDVEHALHVAVIDVHRSEGLAALVVGKPLQQIHHRDGLWPHGVVEAHNARGGALLDELLGVVRLEGLVGPVRGVGESQVSDAIRGVRHLLRLQRRRSIALLSQKWHTILFVKRGG